MSREHIVIVGGGIAGLAAAMELTDPRRCKQRQRGCRCVPDHRHRNCSIPSVVLYELRSELGGKGASVRNEELDFRIEEHGLHIWFGYYENAFRLLDRCHRALDDLEALGTGFERWSTALPDVEAGFRRASTIGLADDDTVDGEWSRWWTTFPEDEHLPWDRVALDEPVDFDLNWLLPELGKRITGLIKAALQSFTTDNQGSRLSRSIELLGGALQHLDPALERLSIAALSWSSYLQKLSARAHRPLLVSTALASLDAVAQLVEYMRKSRDLSISADPTARRLFTVIDLIIGSTRGLLVDGIHSDADLDRLDDIEWSDWLASHNVVSASRDSALVRALSYCLPFAYQRGDRELPSFSAAVGIRLFIRSFFTYRGALMWKMNFGMGEVVFAPLYELLVKRGVEFHFEHQLVRIGTERGRVRQLRFKQSNRQPAKKEPWWPMRKQELRQGTLCYWPRVLPPRFTTNQTVEIDEQTEVILALPLAAIAEKDPHFVESTTIWHEAVHGRSREYGEPGPPHASVATHAVQLWLNEPAAPALGWKEGITVSGFSEPFDTFSDMGHLLPVEGSPKRGMAPKGLIYLCSARPDPRPDRLAHGPTLEDDLALFLGKRATSLWPNLASAEGEAPNREVFIGTLTRQSLQEIRQSLLTPTDSRAPYLRLNDTAAERYNLSLPGAAKLRIHPGNAGYENLYVAGDWTACILNAGCIEAAVISGLLAAEAALGQRIAIVGRGLQR